MLGARTVCRWLGRLVFLTFAGLLLAVLAVLVVVPRVTHGAALTVLTGSMRPALPVGSVVMERPVDPATLRVGDIATYQQAPGRTTYITHRIAAIDTTRKPLMFTFKGDANRVVDVTPVPAGAIRGKVWFDVPFAGRLQVALGQTAIRSAVLVLGVLCLGCYSAGQLVAGVREQRHVRRQDGGDPVLEVLSAPVGAS